MKQSIMKSWRKQRRLFLEKAVSLAPMPLSVSAPSCTVWRPKDSSDCVSCEGLAIRETTWAHTHQRANLTCQMSSWEGRRSVSAEARPGGGTVWGRQPQEKARLLAFWYYARKHFSSLSQPACGILSQHPYQTGLFVMLGHRRVVKQPPVSLLPVATVSLWTFATER